MVFVDEVVDDGCFVNRTANVQTPKVDIRRIFDALTPWDDGDEPALDPTLPLTRSRQVITIEALERDGRAWNVNMPSGVLNNSLMST